MDLLLKNELEYYRVYISESLIRVITQHTPINLLCVRRCIYTHTYKFIKYNYIITYNSLYYLFQHGISA